MRRGALFAVPFDPERLEVHGEAVAMFDKVAQSLTAPNNRDIIGAGQFAVASTGTLALIPGPVLLYPDTALVAVDRHGRVQPLPAPPRAYQPYVPVSRDGRWLAVTIQDLTEAGLWLYDRNGDKLTSLSRDGEQTLPIWAPDGKQLAFGWLKDGRRSLAVQPADGSAPPRVLVPGAFLPTSWSRDGRHVAGLRSGDIAIVTVGDGSVSEQPWFKTAHTEMWAEFSPDGQWLAYGSDESGRSEIYVRPYPGPGTAKQASFEGGTSPAWNHPGGKELFFLSETNQAGRRKMMAVEFDGRTTPGRPTPLFEFDPTVLTIACNPNRCFNVAPNGQHFYAVQAGTPPRAPVVTHINLIPNWFEELKANVPVKR
jgi:serine/threonine-protein kinase